MGHHAQSNREAAPTREYRARGWPQSKLLVRVELAKQLRRSERREPVVQRVVVHISSLVEGTWFVRPLTADHLIGEWG